MPGYLPILVGWIAVLLLAVPYVLRARHPDTRPLAACLIFWTAFSAVALPLFSLLAWLAASSGIADRMPGNTLGIAIVLLAIVPAFAVARWQIRKPPGRPPGMD